MEWNGNGTKQRRHNANKDDLYQYMADYRHVAIWPCVHQVYSFVQLDLSQSLGQEKMYTFLLYFKCIAALLGVFRFVVFFFNDFNKYWPLLKTKN